MRWSGFSDSGGSTPTAPPNFRSITKMTPLSAITGIERFHFRIVVIRDEEHCLMPDEVKEEALRVIRSFGGAALAIAAICAYAFVGGAKQCGVGAGFGTMILVWFFGFPVFLVAGGVGFWFGWRPRTRSEWAAFLVLCLLPAIFAAVMSAPPSSCRMDL